jgi:hypothetical protein
MMKAILVRLAAPVLVWMGALSVVPLVLVVPVQASQTEPAGQKVAYTAHSGYFRRNDSGLEDPLHALVITDQKRFDQIFGVAFVMGAKPRVLPEKAFDTLVVCALIRQGNKVWTYTVTGVTQQEGVLTIQYKATAADGGTATFASPLIVSVPKGDYRQVRFVENDKLVAEPKFPAKETAK